VLFVFAMGRVAWN